MLVFCALSEARVAYDGAAIAILPVIVLAMLFQFRSDRHFSFLGDIGVPELWWRGIGLLVGAALVITMFVGWFQSVSELAAAKVQVGHGNRLGFAAAMLALAFGITDEIGQQAARIVRERRHQDSNATHDRCEVVSQPDEPE